MQACRSRESAIAAEVFMNHVGYNLSSSVSRNPGTVRTTTVLGNKMAGPTGFEPATSRLTIWRPKPG